MDALSLLCTLHADGPATLQRLRARGCRELGAFLGLDHEEISRELDVEPAAARRLLREARLLADRLGPEALEMEEAPPVMPRRQPDVAPSPMPVVPPVLDETDASLVAKILSTSPEPAAVPAEELPQVEVPQQAAPEEPEPEPELAADGAAEVEPEPEPEPQPEVSLQPAALRVPLAPDAITVGALPGLDRAMVEDLAAVGISTLGQLGAAESLTLTRSLGVTFAQARRMRFLARRAADGLRSVQAEPAAVEGSDEPIHEIQPVAAPASVPVQAPSSELSSGPTPESISESISEPIPESTLEPISELSPEPGPELLAAAVVAESPVAEPEAPMAASEAIPSVEPEVQVQPAPEPGPDPGGSKHAFWQPRAFLAEAEPSEEDEPQGVKVDPSEIEARPRFGDRLARAAREGGLPQAKGSKGRTVLGWNFEIPRPATEQLPLASFGGNGAGAPDRPAKDEEQASQASSDDGAGPFA